MLLKVFTCFEDTGFFSNCITFFAPWIRDMRVKRSAERQELLVPDYCSGCILQHKKILTYSQATTEHSSSHNYRSTTFLRMYFSSNKWATVCMWRGEVAFVE